MTTKSLAALADALEEVLAHCGMTDSDGTVALIRSLAEADASMPVVCFESEEGGHMATQEREAAKNSEFDFWMVSDKDVELVRRSDALAAVAAALQKP
jgi:hypothetical protein